MPYVMISNSYKQIDCCVNIVFYNIVLLVRTLICYDQVDDLLPVRTLYYDQVYHLLPVKTLYITTKFMICYWSEGCMLWPSLWFVTGQNTVCYDQVHDLLLVRTLLEIPGKLSHIYNFFVLIYYGRSPKNLKNEPSFTKFGWTVAELQSFKECYFFRIFFQDGRHWKMLLMAYLRCDI
jgi:hypothetical protein